MEYPQGQRQTGGEEAAPAADTGAKAEVTRATVVFADVVGFTELLETAGAERAYFVVTGALRILDGIARRHGGAVDKYLGDCLMAVFGHPVPIDDAASAAVAAALEMREQFRDYSRGLDVGVRLDLVIGINTGTMVAGDVRDGVVREFHVLGDAVNIAARLKAKAPRGGIYVGPETHRETADAFEYRPLGSMRLKGKTAEVAIFDLVARRQESGRAETAWHGTGGQFVGRERELAALTEAIRTLTTGKGGVVLLHGDEGMGKSRLVAEALAAVPGVMALSVRGRRASEDGPDTIVADVLRAGGGDARGGDACAALAAHLAEQAARQPVVAVVDDLHRAELVAVERLLAVVDQLRTQPVLFILACRPEPAATVQALRDAVLGSRGLELQLGPLSEEESGRLVDAVATSALDADARALVMSYAGGNPARLSSGIFLEPALRAERARGGSSRRAGETERRRATILFADITGFTSMTERLGAERAYPVVVGCLRLLDGIARKHGGTVEKYLGDCVMALFGVPEAIEDAPRAAVNAAIEMRRRVRAYSDGIGGEVRLDVHSGINTGLGIAGDVSGPLIREFAVMGDPVSVADELKDLAPAGHVYVGVEVQRATREVFEYREVDAATRERRDTPVRVFELLSEQERVHRARIGAERRVFSALVGRDRELGLLRDALTRLGGRDTDGSPDTGTTRVAGEGQGGIVSVVAAAGLGKSRLLAELATAEEARGVAWCEGRSVAAGEHRSFHTIADLVRSLVGIVDGDDDAQAGAKLGEAVRRLLPAESDDVLPYLATLLGLPLEESGRARLAELRGDAMEKLTLRSVTQLLRARGEAQPVVVVLDDLHWADGSSIEMLQALLRLCEEHPILFVAVFRPGFAATSERIRDAARADYADRSVEIELGPLDGSASRTMLGNLFRQGDLPHATRQLIEEKAQGNPFYIEEVIRALVDEGAVEHADGRFRATDKIGTVVIPGTIQELVMARVDGLPPDRRQLLQIASVVGGSFHVDVLAAIVENPATLANDLEHLVATEFLVPSERLPGEHAFKHRLIQEVTYDGLLHARRETLHRAVGEAMERVFSEDVAGYAGMLAYHYGKGGAVERAEAYLFRAGAEAARAAAPSEALHFFEEASKLYLQLHGGGGDPEKRALLEKNIAQALYYKGRFVEAIEHFNLALRLLGDRVVERRVELGVRFVGNLLAVLARLYGPSLGRRRAAATPRQREIMELRYARAEATVTAQPTRHLFDSMDSLALLQRIDPTSVPAAGKFYAGAAALFAFGGISFGVSRRLSTQARALVRGDALDEYLYERAMSFTYRVLEGDWADEHEIEPARIAESVRNGQLWGPTTYLGLLGEKRIHRGDFTSARACVEEIDQIWDLFQYDLAKTNHYYLHTLLPLEESDWSAAIAAADAYYDENPEDLLHILALGAKAKAQACSGDLDGAEATLTHAAEVVARSSPVPPFHASSYHRSRLLLDVARFEQAIARGDTGARKHWDDRARKSAGTALRVSAKVAWRRTEVLRLASRYHALAGRRGYAHRLLERSAEVGERLRARPEVARTYAAAARMLANGTAGRRFRGRDAAACLEHARAELGRLGLRRDLESVADL